MIDKNKQNQKYSRTKKGLITKIYAHQKHVSKRRGHQPPTYTKQELKDWLYSQEKFHVLYDNWRRSGYLKDLVPSIDRIDNYTGYIMDNIQLMTWGENNFRNYSDRYNGDNKKQLKAIIQYTKNGLFIDEYYSAALAERKTNINRSGIGMCCRGIRKTAGGYNWEYKEKLEYEI